MRYTGQTEVDEALCVLKGDVFAVLGSDFFGLYLYGSLATGDFDPRTSDIDFAVVTVDRLSVEQVAALESVHKKLWSSGLRWAPKLEGSYVPKSVIRRHQRSEETYPCVNEGRFYLAPLGSDWILQRHILREHGVVIHGPAPETLIDPVTPDRIRESVAAYLREWWEPMLARSKRLDDPAYQAYAVLSVCRAAYTLETGRIASKRESAAWAIESLEPRWRALIEQALSPRIVPLASMSPSPAELIRHVLSLIAD